MRRWLSLVLSLILALGLCVPAMAAEELAEPDAPLPAEAEDVAPEVPAPAAAELPEETVTEVSEEAALVEDEPMAISSGTCGTGVTWRMTGTVLSIGGSGDMSDYNTVVDDNPPWYGQNITAVVIGSGVTSIGDYAFVRCAQLTRVTIPSTVTTIGQFAFDECSALHPSICPTVLIPLRPAPFPCAKGSPASPSRPR